MKPYSFCLRAISALLIFTFSFTETIARADAQSVSAFVRTGYLAIEKFRNAFDARSELRAFGLTFPNDSSEALPVPNLVDKNRSELRSDINPEKSIKPPSFHLFASPHFFNLSWQFLFPIGFSWGIPLSFMKIAGNDWMIAAGAINQIFSRSELRAKKVKDGTNVLKHTKADRLHWLRSLKRFFLGLSVIVLVAATFIWTHEHDKLPLHPTFGRFAIHLSAMAVVSFYMFRWIIRYFRTGSLLRDKIRTLSRSSLVYEFEFGQIRNKLLILKTPDGGTHQLSLGPDGNVRVMSFREFESGFVRFLLPYALIVREDSRLLIHKNKIALQAIGPHKVKIELLDKSLTVPVVRESRLNAIQRILIIHPMIIGVALGYVMMFWNFMYLFAHAFASQIGGHVKCVQCIEEFEFIVDIWAQFFLYMIPVGYAVAGAMFKLISFGYKKYMRASRISIAPAQELPDKPVLFGETFGKNSGQPFTLNVHPFKERQVGRVIRKLKAIRESGFPVNDQTIQNLYRLVRTVQSDPFEGPDIEFELSKWLEESSDLKAIAAIVTGWFQARSEHTAGLSKVLEERFGLNKKQIEKLRHLSVSSKIRGEDNEIEEASSVPPVSYELQLKTRTIYNVFSQEFMDDALMRVNSIDGKKLKDWVEQVFRQRVSPDSEVSVRSIFVHGSYIYGTVDEPRDLDLIAIVDSNSLAKPVQIEAGIPKQVFQSMRGRLVSSAQVYFLTREQLKSSKRAIHAANAGILLKTKSLYDEPLTDIRNSDSRRLLHAASELTDAFDLIKKRSERKDSAGEAMRLLKWKAFRRLSEAILYINAIDPSTSAPLYEIVTLRSEIESYMENGISERKMTEELKRVYRKVAAAALMTRVSLVWRQLEGKEGDGHQTKEQAGRSELRQIEEVVEHFPNLPLLGSDLSFPPWVLRLIRERELPGNARYYLTGLAEIAKARFHVNLEDEITRLPPKKWRELIEEVIPNERWALSQRHRGKRFMLWLVTSMALTLSIWFVDAFFSTPLRSLLGDASPLKVVTTFWANHRDPLLPDIEYRILFPWVRRFVIWFASFGVPGLLVLRFILKIRATPVEIRRFFINELFLRPGRITNAEAQKLLEADFSILRSDEEIQNGWPFLSGINDAEQKTVDENLLMKRSAPISDGHSDDASKKVRSELRTNFEEKEKAFIDQVRELASLNKMPWQLSKENFGFLGADYYDQFHERYPTLSRVFRFDVKHPILIRALIETKRSIKELDQEMVRIMDDPVLSRFVKENPSDAFYQDSLTYAFLVSAEAQEAFKKFVAAWLDKGNEHWNEIDRLLFDKRMRQPIGLFLANPRTRHQTAEFISRIVFDDLFWNPPYTDKDKKDLDQGIGRPYGHPVMRQESSEVSFFWFYLAPIFDEFKKKGDTDETAAQKLLYLHNHFYGIMRAAFHGPYAPFRRTQWEDWDYGKEEVSKPTVDAIVRKVNEAYQRRSELRAPNSEEEQARAQKIIETVQYLHREAEIFITERKLPEVTSGHADQFLNQLRVHAPPHGFYASLAALRDLFSNQSWALSLPQDLPNKLLSETAKQVKQFHPGRRNFLTQLVSGFVTLSTPSLPMGLGEYAAYVWQQASHVRFVNENMDFISYALRHYTLWGDYGYRALLTVFESPYDSWLDRANEERFWSSSHPSERELREEAFQNIYGSLLLKRFDETDSSLAAEIRRAAPQFSGLLKEANHFASSKAEEMAALGSSVDGRDIFNSARKNTMAFNIGGALQNRELPTSIRRWVRSRLAESRQFFGMVSRLGTKELFRIDRPAGSGEIESVENSTLGRIKQTFRAKIDYLYSIVEKWNRIDRLLWEREGGWLSVSADDQTFYDQWSSANGQEYLRKELAIIRQNLKAIEQIEKSVPKQIKSSAAAPKRSELRQGRINDALGGAFGGREGIGKLIQRLQIEKGLSGFPFYSLSLVRSWLGNRASAVTISNPIVATRPIFHAHEKSLNNRVANPAVPIYWAKVMLDLAMNSVFSGLAFFMKVTYSSLSVNLRILTDKYPTINIILSQYLFYLYKILKTSRKNDPIQQNGQDENGDFPAGWQGQTERSELRLPRRASTIPRTMPTASLSELRTEWAAEIQQLVLHGLPFLALNFSEEGYLFRAMRNGLRGSLLSGEFAYLNDGAFEYMSMWQERNRAFLVSEDPKDVLHIAQFENGSPHSAIVVFPSKLFHDEMNAGRAAIMTKHGLAGTLTGIKWPLMTNPVSIQDAAFIIVAPQTKQYLDNLLANDQASGEEEKLRLRLLEYQKQGIYQKIASLDFDPKGMTQDEAQEKFNAFLSNKAIHPAQVVDSEIFPRHSDIANDDEVRSELRHQAMDHETPVVESVDLRAIRRAVAEVVRRRAYDTPVVFESNSPERVRDHVVRGNRKGDFGIHLHLGLNGIGLLFGIANLSDKPGEVVLTNPMADLNSLTAEPAWYTGARDFFIRLDEISFNSEKENAEWQHTVRVITEKAKLAVAKYSKDIKRGMLQDRSTLHQFYELTDSHGNSTNLWTMFQDGNIQKKYFRLKPADFIDGAQNKEGEEVAGRQKRKQDERSELRNVLTPHLELKAIAAKIQKAFEDMDYPAFSSPFQVSEDKKMGKRVKIEIREVSAADLPHPGVPNVAIVGGTNLGGSEGMAYWASIGKGPAVNFILIPVFNGLSSGKERPDMVFTEYAVFFDRNGNLVLGHFKEPIAIHTFAYTKSLDDELAKRFNDRHIPLLSSQAAMTAAHDKAEFHQTMVDLGAKTPRTMVLEKSERDIEVLTEKIQSFVHSKNSSLRDFGITIKPYDGLTGIGVRMFKTAEAAEAAKFAHALLESNKKILMQDRVANEFWKNPEREHVWDWNLRVLSTWDHDKIVINEDTIEIRFKPWGSGPNNLSRGSRVMLLREFFKEKGFDEARKQFFLDQIRGAIEPFAYKLEQALAGKDGASKTFAKNLGLVGWDLQLSQEGKWYIIEANIGPVGGLSTISGLLPEGEKDKVLLPISNYLAQLARRYFEEEHGVITNEKGDNLSVEHNDHVTVLYAEALNHIQDFYENLEMLRQEREATGSDVLAAEFIETTGLRMKAAEIKYMVEAADQAQTAEKERVTLKDLRERLSKLAEQFQSSNNDQTRFWTLLTIISNYRFLHLSANRMILETLEKLYKVDPDVVRTALIRGAIVMYQPPVMQSIMLTLGYLDREAPGDRKLESLSVLLKYADAKVPSVRHASYKAIRFLHHSGSKRELVARLVKANEDTMPLISELAAMADPGLFDPIITKLIEMKVKQPESPKIESTNDALREAMNPSELPPHLAMIVSPQWISDRLDQENVRILAERFGYIDSEVHDLLNSDERVQHEGDIKIILNEIGLVTKGLLDAYQGYPRAFPDASQHTLIEYWQDRIQRLRRSLLPEQWVEKRLIERDASSWMPLEMNQALMFAALRDIDRAGNIERYTEPVLFDWKRSEELPGTFFRSSWDNFRQKIYPGIVDDVSEVIKLSGASEALRNLSMSYMVTDRFQPMTDTRPEKMTEARLHFYAKWMMILQILEVKDGRLSFKFAYEPLIEAEYQSRFIDGVDANDSQEVQAFLSDLASDQNRKLWKYVILDPMGVSKTDALMDKVEPSQEWRLLSEGARAVLKLYAYNLHNQKDLDYRDVERLWRKEFEAILNEERLGRQLLPSIGMELQNSNGADELTYGWKGALEYFGIPSPVRPEFYSMVEAAFPPVYSSRAYVLAVKSLQDAGWMRPYNKGLSVHLSVGGDLADLAKWLALSLRILEEDLSIKAFQSFSGLYHGWFDHIKRKMSKGFVHLNESSVPVSSSDKNPGVHTEIRTTYFNMLTPDGDILDPSYKKFIPAFQLLTAAAYAFQKQKSGQNGTELEARLADVWQSYQAEMEALYRNPKYGSAELLDANWHENTGDPHDPMLVRKLDIIQKMVKIHEFFEKHPKAKFELQSKTREIFLRHAGEVEQAINRSELRAYDEILIDIQAKTEQIGRFFLEELGPKFFPQGDSGHPAELIQGMDKFTIQHLFDRIHAVASRTHTFLITRGRLNELTYGLLSNTLFELQEMLHLYAYDPDIDAVARQLDAQSKTLQEATRKIQTLTLDHMLEYFLDKRNLTFEKRASENDIKILNGLKFALSSIHFEHNTILHMIRDNLDFQRMPNNFYEVLFSRIIHFAIQNPRVHKIRIERFGRKVAILYSDSNGKRLWREKTIEMKGYQAHQLLLLLRVLAGFDLTNPKKPQTQPFWFTDLDKGFQPPDDEDLEAADYDSDEATYTFAVQFKPRKTKGVDDQLYIHIDRGESERSEVNIGTRSELRHIAESAAVSVETLEQQIRAKHDAVKNLNRQLRDLRKKKADLNHRLGQALWRLDDDRDHKLASVKSKMAADLKMFAGNRVNRFQYYFFQFYWKEKGMMLAKWILGSVATVSAVGSIGFGFNWLWLSGVLIPAGILYSIDKLARFVFEPSAGLLFEAEERSREAWQPEMDHIEKRHYAKTTNVNRDLHKRLDPVNDEIVRLTNEKMQLETGIRQLARQAAELMRLESGLNDHALGLAKSILDLSARHIIGEISFDDLGWEKRLARFDNPYQALVFVLRAVELERQALRSKLLRDNLEDIRKKLEEAVRKHGADFGLSVHRKAHSTEEMLSYFGASVPDLWKIDLRITPLVSTDPNQWLRVSDDAEKNTDLTSKRSELHAPDWLFYVSFGIPAVLAVFITGLFIYSVRHPDDASSERSSPETSNPAQDQNDEFGPSKSELRKFDESNNAPRPRIRWILNSIWNAQGGNLNREIWKPSLAHARRLIKRFRRVPGMGEIILELGKNFRNHKAFDAVLAELFAAEYLEKYVPGSKVIGLRMRARNGEIDIVLRVGPTASEKKPKTGAVQLAPGIYLAEVKYGYGDDPQLVQWKQAKLKTQLKSYSNVALRLSQAGLDVRGLILVSAESPAYVAGNLRRRAYWRASNVPKSGFSLKNLLIAFDPLSYPDKRQITPPLNIDVRRWASVASTPATVFRKLIPESANLVLRQPSKPRKNTAPDTRDPNRPARLPKNSLETVSQLKEALNEHGLENEAAEAVLSALASQARGFKIEGLTLKASDSLHYVRGLKEGIRNGKPFWIVRLHRAQRSRFESTLVARWKIPDEAVLDWKAANRSELRVPSQYPGDREFKSLLRQFEGRQRLIAEEVGVQKSVVSRWVKRYRFRTLSRQLRSKREVKTKPSSYPGDRIFKAALIRHEANRRLMAKELKTSERNVSTWVRRYRFKTLAKKLRNQRAVKTRPSSFPGRKAFRALLIRFKGNQQKVARKLDIDPAMITRWVKRYGYKKFAERLREKAARRSELRTDSRIVRLLDERNDKLVPAAILYMDLFLNLREHGAELQDLTGRDLFGIAPHRHPEEGMAYKIMFTLPNQLPKAILEVVSDEKGEKYNAQDSDHPVFFKFDSKMNLIAVYITLDSEKTEYLELEILQRADKETLKPYFINEEIGISNRSGNLILLPQPKSFRLSASNLVLRASLTQRLIDAARSELRVSDIPAEKLAPVQEKARLVVENQDERNALGLLNQYRASVLALFDNPAFSKGDIVERDAVHHTVSSILFQQGSWLVDPDGNLSQVVNIRNGWGKPPVQREGQAPKARPTFVALRDLAGLGGKGEITLNELIEAGYRLVQYDAALEPKQEEEKNGAASDFKSLDTQTSKAPEVRSELRSEWEELDPEEPEENQEKIVTLKEFRELLSGAISKERSFEHHIEIKMPGGLTRWVDDAFLELNFDHITAGYHQFQKTLQDRLGVYDDEKILAKDLLRLKEIKGDENFVIDLFALLLSKTNSIVRIPKNDIKKSFIIGITEDGLERYRGKNKLKREAARLKKQAKNDGRSSEVKDFSKESRPYKRFSDSISALSPAVLSEIKSHLQQPTLKDSALVKDYWREKYHAILQILWDHDIISPESLAELPVERDQYEDPNTWMSPLVRFVARLLDSEQAYPAHTYSGRLLAARKKMQEISGNDFTDPNVRAIFLDWIKIERGLDGVLDSVLDQLSMPAIRTGPLGSFDPRDITTRPYDWNLREEITTIINSEIPSQIIPKINEALARYGVQEIGAIHVTKGHYRALSLQFILKPDYFPFLGKANVIDSRTARSFKAEAGLQIYKFRNREFPPDSQIARIERKDDHFVIFRYEHRDDDDEGEQPYSVKKLAFGASEEPDPNGYFYVQSLDDQSVVIRTVNANHRIWVKHTDTDNMISWDGFTFLKEDGHKRIFVTEDGLVQLSQLANDPNFVFVQTGDGKSMFYHGEDDVTVEKPDGGRKIFKNLDRDRRLHEHHIRYNPKTHSLTVRTSVPQLNQTYQFSAQSHDGQNRAVVKVRYRPLPPADVEGFAFSGRKKVTLQSGRESYNAYFTHYRSKDGLLHLWQDESREGNWDLNLLTADGQHIFGRWYYDRRGQQGEGLALGSKNENLVLKDAGPDMELYRAHKIHYDSATKTLKLELITNWDSVDVNKEIPVRVKEGSKPVLLTVVAQDIHTHQENQGTDSVDEQVVPGQSFESLDAGNAEPPATRSELRKVADQMNSIVPKPTAETDAAFQKFAGIESSDHTAQAQILGILPNLGRSELRNAIIESQSQQHKIVVFVGTRSEMRMVKDFVSSQNIPAERVIVTQVVDPDVIFGDQKRAELRLVGLPNDETYAFQVTRLLHGFDVQTRIGTEQMFASIFKIADALRSELRQRMAALIAA